MEPVTTIGWDLKQAAQAIGAVDHETWVDAIAPIAGRVSQLARLSCRIREAAGLTPAADSEGMRELAEQGQFAGVWDPEPIEGADSYINLLTVAAEDHMESFADLVTGPRTPLYSFVVLGRSALECQALAAWLAEPVIGTRRRVARNLNERMHGVAAQQRLPAAVRPPDTLRPRLLEAAAVLTKLPARRNLPAEFEERRCSQTELVRRLCGDNDLAQVGYSHFSAISHGVLWGLLNSIHQDDGDPGGASSLGPPLRALVIKTKDVATVAALMLLGHMVAFGHVLERNGWRDPDWPSACRSALSLAQEVFDPNTDSPAARGPASTAPPLGLWVPLA